jgi:hypothetical protein
MVEIFKSPVNIQNSVVARYAATSELITIGANTSARVTLTFARAFDSMPVVFYSILCADALFGLSHYIAEVTNTGVIVCIENQALVERTIKITYEARAN